MKRKQSCPKSQYVAWAFLLPNLLGVLVFTMMPMLRVLFSSFQSAVGGRWMGMQNYLSVIHNSAFQTALYNTARFTLACVPILVSLSLLLAVWLQ